MAATTDTPKRPRRRTVAVVLAAGVLAVSGIGYAAASEVTGQVQHVDVFESVKNRPDNDGGTNILLVGSDDRTGLSRKERKELSVGQGEYGRHTDSMMLVHIADDGSIGVVSIPRDSYVEIPSHTGASGITSKASKQKINAAYSIGGPTLAVQTVEQATGVHIDHYAEINFAGFVNMVDGLGGVPICTKTPIQDEKAGLDLPAGEQTLDGAQALGFVRARYFDPSADLGRMKRQQQFLGAMFNQATSPAVLINPPRLFTFLNSAAGSITVDEDFSNREMWNMMGKLRSVSPSAISFQTIPIGEEINAGGVGSVVVWDEQKSEELFAKLKTGAALTGPGSAKKSIQTVEIAPSEISIRVYNGSTVSGLGSKAAKELEAAGYGVTGTVLNASDSTGTETVIEFDSRYSTSVKTLE
ncbi:MAG: LCP family protein, partial [Actinobacteria bacterium]|nr:LCP family protein [Actinomycetota bacterium]